MPDAPILRLDRVTRRFGDVTAVRDVSLHIGRGEFFSLLGPSGCGKTTTLRLIAGFDDPDSGDIRILGDVVNGRRPYQRPIGIVFQSYALFPHLDVAANVGFGLVERRVPREEIGRKVARALELVRLDPATFLRRRPDELSGGQRQRVALARALVLEPPILLLDEPLGALDLQLRKEMQFELKELNRRLGVTFVLVTHDQQEALAMSDRIAVMAGGSVEQCGAPAEIYDRPRTAFVAGFIGEANVLTGAVVGPSGSGVTVDGPAGSWSVIAAEAPAGHTIRVAIRPERHRLLSPDDPAGGSNAIAATVRDVVFLGDTTQLIVELRDGTTARATVRNDGAPRQAWAPGDRARLAWQPGDGHVLAS